MNVRFNRDVEEMKNRGSEIQEKERQKLKTFIEQSRQKETVSELSA